MAVAQARDAEQRMADAETQYAPLAQQAGAMQRELAEAQAAAQAAAAQAARLSRELDHSRCAHRFGRLPGPSVCGKPSAVKHANVSKH